MRKILVLLASLFILTHVNGQEQKQICIGTEQTYLILQVAPNGRLYQAYLGDKLVNQQDLRHLSSYVKGGTDGSVSTVAGKFIPVRVRKITLNRRLPSPTPTETRVPFCVTSLPIRRR
ncbi:alpha-galactosidase [Bacteroides reticulotermitis JCM 10512]|uniref:Alpha-galactosidase n=1 Tax=Bacteroides reticulotermitis JCM 10512 TaxID=1445607 RepID=W4UQ59_9BACE|nr:alpha-galactosidase [Bacteroides reticulotermitis JCM 10512]